MAKLSKSETRIPGEEALGTIGNLVPAGSRLDDAFEMFCLLREAESHKRLNFSFFDSNSATMGKSRVINEYFRKGFAQI